MGERRGRGVTEAAGDLRDGQTAAGEVRAADRTARMSYEHRTPEP